MIDNFELEEYAWLSNFYLVDIEYKGIIYPSVEHAFQSAKCENKDWKAKCLDRNIKPGKIKVLAKHVGMIEGWNQLRLEVMKECIRNKFSKDPLRQKLIDTGQEHIQEGNHWYDAFWGVRTDTGEGKNHLGRIIMEIRDELIFDIGW